MQMLASYRGFEYHTVRRTLAASAGIPAKKTLWYFLWHAELMGEIRQRIFKRLQAEFESLPLRQIFPTKSDTMPKFAI